MVLSFALSSGAATMTRTNSKFGVHSVCWRYCRWVRSLHVGPQRRQRGLSRGSNRNLVSEPGTPNGNLSVRRHLLHRRGRPAAPPPPAPPPVVPPRPSLSTATCSAATFLRRHGWGAHSATAPATCSTRGEASFPAPGRSADRWGAGAQGG